MKSGDPDSGEFHQDQVPAKHVPHQSETASPDLIRRKTYIRPDLSDQP
jgi:hypothetical protein